MQFVPMKKMMERVDNYGNSDYERCSELLYAGEFLVKMTVSAFVASIQDDPDNHRYQLLHTLVRANGVGEWVAVIDDICRGTASNHLSAALFPVRNVLTKKVGNVEWQHEAVDTLQKVLIDIEAEKEDRSTRGKRIDLKVWFQKFALLRNKTRGHRSMTPGDCAKVVQNLQSSIETMVANNPVFQLPWAYIHRNLSGEYQVVSLGGDVSKFSELGREKNYPNGIYLWADAPKLVELIHGDLDLDDFFVPNGAFNGKTYELHSPINNQNRKADAHPYLQAVGSRPSSETEGKGKLDVIGSVWTNLPSIPEGYVQRASLEDEVERQLVKDQQYPIVTLVGRGGIGKTSLLLTVLHKIAFTDRYYSIIWFSARDIDLTLSGPKNVKPNVLTSEDIAKEYCRLIEVSDNTNRDISANSILTKHMTGDESDYAPTLFVFDNFETVSNPVDVFNWIDSNIRLPNKAVITSRLRAFRADFPITIPGMEEDQARKLIEQMAQKLNIETKIDTDIVKKIITGSGGHPYIIKILLGEIAKTGRFTDPSSMIVRETDILDALFERTYDNLSPLAARAFLTLSGWHQHAPQLAVEAVLCWRTTDNAEDALDELVRMSLVERTTTHDNYDFLEVPIAAALYGQKKLLVSTDHLLIQDDISFLKLIEIPETTRAIRREKIESRINVFFQQVQKRILEGSISVDKIRPVLEYVARSYTPAWLLFADLEKAVGTAPEHEAECVRRFLQEVPQGSPQALAAWLRLVEIYISTKDISGVCSAFLRAAEIKEPKLREINKIVTWLKDSKEEIDITQRKGLFEELAALTKRYLPQATASDLSRFAWLHLRMGDKKGALEIAGEGMKKDPGSWPCRKLIRQIDI